VALANWPITAADLRKALSYGSTQGDEDELALYAKAVCEEIDAATGRRDRMTGELVNPTRWVITETVTPDVGDPYDVEVLPSIFVLAAREAAKLWWQQSFNGPKGQPEGAGGPPMGADLPSKVKGWLSKYPPVPGIS
jgi:hypothetical protein